MKRLLSLIVTLGCFINSFSQSDDCSTASPVSSGTVCSPVVGTTAGATQSMPGCAGTADDDVWYKFTATSVSHSLAVTGSSNFSPVFEVFSGTCGSLVSLDCNDNASYGGTASTHLTGLSIGSVYYFRIYHYYSGPGSGSFTVCLTEGTAPVNDECVNALPLTSSTVCSPVAGTSSWASQSMSNCAGNADDDVWYKFTASAVTHSLAVTGSSNYSPVFEVFSGSCGSLTSIDCNDNASTGGMGSSHLSGLSVGSTYYVRVYHYYSGSGSDTFTICLMDAPAPANDDCGSAITISGSSSVCATPVAGTSLFANESMPACAGNADDDVWYQFTASSASHSLEVAGSSGYDAVVEIFSGSCGTLTSLSCNDNSGAGGTEQVHFGNLAIGSTYYFRVYHYYAGSGTNTFTVCLTTPDQQPVNDDCSGAMSLSVTPNCQTTPTVVSSVGATQSLPACAGTADDDVWFQFMATAAHETIDVTGDATTDAVVELFSGSCGSLNSLSCSDYAGNGQTESLNSPALTIGQTYYFRVYDYHAAGGKTFTVSVVTRELSATASASTICRGNSVTLTASGTPTFTWSNGVVNGVAFTPTASTIYTVSGIGTGSCVNTATVSIVVSTPQTPEICMVTVDTANVNNVIYWEKYNYNNVDSMIIHREVVANTYQRIGAVDNLAFSRFVDTVRHIGFRNGDPNIRSYRYKLQIRDTCGNYSALSPYHTSLFLNNTGSTFNWNFYDIEGQNSPVVNYELYRDDFNTGAFNLVGTVQATLGVTSYTLTDPNFATFAGTARWGLTADGFACNPSFRLANPANPMSTVYKSKANVKNNFTIADPPADPDPQAVREINLDAYIRLMPNPAHELVTVSSAFALQSVNVYNSLGALVQRMILGKETRVDLNIQGLGDGIYSVEILTEKGGLVKKLVVQQ